VLRALRGRRRQLLLPELSENLHLPEGRHRHSRGLGLLQGLEAESFGGVGRDHGLDPFYCHEVGGSQIELVGGIVRGLTVRGLTGPSDGAESNDSISPSPQLPNGCV